jgi:hypothetical protein
VELWNNQHPFQRCNSCPLISMKATQKTCTIEFPKLEIGVRLAYHIATFVFCDSGLSPSLLSKFKEKKNQLQASWTAQRKSVSTQLVNCDVGYNLWIKHLEKHQSSWHSSVSAMYAKFSNKNHERLVELCYNMVM